MIKIWIKLSDCSVENKTLEAEGNGTRRERGKPSKMLLQKSRIEMMD